jgi:hypothetical protein
MKRKAQKVIGARACGSQILVELLSDQESMNTRLSVGKASGIPPQAFIVDIGPASAEAPWGFEVGDRVLLQGNYVPVPKFNDNDREYGMVEPTAIKCILAEESGILEA